MGFITRHSIGGIHKEAKAQTKLMQGAEARANQPLPNASLRAGHYPADAYWAAYVEQLTAAKGKKK
jgi:hypothetical protein